MHVNRFGRNQKWKRKRPPPIRPLGWMRTMLVTNVASQHLRHVFIHLLASRADKVQMGGGKKGYTMMVVQEGYMKGYTVLHLLSSVWASGRMYTYELAIAILGSRKFTNCYVISLPPPPPPPSALAYSTRWYKSRNIHFKVLAKYDFDVINLFGLRIIPAVCVSNTIILVILDFEIIFCCIEDNLSVQVGIGICIGLPCLVEGYARVRPNINCEEQHYV